MLSTAGLATTATLKSVDNKIPDVRNLAKKKKIMMQKYQIFGLYILPHLITLIVQIIYRMQR